MDLGADGITEALHYLDDFLLLGSTAQRRSFLSTALNLCKRLGVPIADHKVEGPATVLPFLGILIDTEKSIVRLPHEKLKQSWQGKWS